MQAISMRSNHSILGVFQQQKLRFGNQSLKEGHVPSHLPSHLSDPLSITPHVARANLLATTDRISQLKGEFLALLAGHSQSVQAHYLNELTDLFSSSFSHQTK